ncbi:hypothetical protein K402DRAFT_393666 [Aulographum hederae CBS 113979]|uniref:NADH-ubiquinone oxidoreductase 14 kDa subunit n=1 Tax=Aulographum hederae CBS 113979 TaxID=1176131 RepID=A0A6G1H045_9PEZI|nr:hypothetical protein K402DRAFT_393666 [Aulographum hederae CBS 113979]
MRPLFRARNGALWYGIYGGIGASFGYWLQGVDQRQMAVINARRDRLLEKRRKAAEREGGIHMGTPRQLKEDGTVATL